MYILHVINAYITYTYICIAESLLEIFIYVFACVGS